MGASFSCHLLCVCVCGFSCAGQLFATLWAVACQAPLSMQFSRQEYWSWWPFPSPGVLPNPEIEPTSPAWQEASLPLCHLDNLETLIMNSKYSQCWFTLYSEIITNSQDVAKIVPCRNILFTIHPVSISYIYYNRRIIISKSRNWYWYKMSNSSLAFYHICRFI